MEKLIKALKKVYGCEWSFYESTTSSGSEWLTMENDDDSSKSFSIKDCWEDDYYFVSYDFRVDKEISCCLTLGRVDHSIEALQNAIKTLIEKANKLG